MTSPEETALSGIVALADWMGKTPDADGPLIVITSPSAPPIRVFNPRHARYDSGCEIEDTDDDDTTSLAPEVTNFVFENGRRYHAYKEGLYPFPNDKEELDREELVHDLYFNLNRGKLHLSKLEKPISILDLGTGVGRWPICMAGEYPKAALIGVDLSPHQGHWIPDNVDFIVDDVEEVWSNPPDSLDLVHVRSMATAVRDWKTLFKSAIKSIVPGGYMEVQDIHWAFRCDDGSMPDDWAPSVLVDKVRQGLVRLGVDMYAPTMHVHRAEAVGFTNLEHEMRRVPVGAWARDPELKVLGRQVRDVLLAGLHAMAVGPLTRGLGWAPDDVHRLLSLVRKALVHDRRVHAYVLYYSVCAQKPE